MSGLQIVRIDGIKWWISAGTNGSRLPTPLCPTHDLRLTPKPPREYSAGNYHNGSIGDSVELQCAEGPHKLTIPRKYSNEKQYVIDRIDAKIFKGSKTINLDDEAVPIAKSKQYSKDEKFFITTQLMESKRGLQVVVYAGEKGSGKKTQILINPTERRLAFDQSDLHPSDVFTKIEVTFIDGTKSSISRPKR